MSIQPKQSPPIEGKNLTKYQYYVLRVYQIARLKGKFLLRVFFFFGKKHFCKYIYFKLLFLYNFKIFYVKNYFLKILFNTFKSKKY